jgi:hypothetical protein
MKYFEGQWRKEFFNRGNDSNLRSIERNRNQPYSRVTQLSLAEVLIPQAEPFFRQHKVSAQLIRGGILTSVAWPGPNVVVSETGVPSPTGGIHGLFEAPMPGQQVLVGFVDGNAHNPVVVQKYPYNASHNPVLEAAYYLPMTSKAVGPTDVILGHHTGSFIALRGTLPLPGAIEVECPTTFRVNARVGVDVLTLGKIKISGGATGVEISDLVGNTITIATTGIQLKTASGDSAKWIPNCLAACLFTGTPHGGPTAGILQLKG